MNKILNGDFSSGGAYWTNPSGGLAFSIGVGTASGTSDPDGPLEWTYKMCQQFSSSDEIITAKITVWAAWKAYSDVWDGYNQFIVELEKPNTTKVTLVDTTKTAVIGSGNILDGVDIKTHMATYGNYKLWLTLKTKSAATAFLDPPVEYTQSQGWYDNINLDITVKKYKAVHEVFGCSETLATKATFKKAVHEVIGIVESYSTQVTHPAINYQTASDLIGIVEGYSTKIKRVKKVHEVVGIVEGLKIKRTQGNLVTTYTLGDRTQWETTPKTETAWVKKKIDIAS